MKVALLFYGQARHVSNTPEYISVIDTVKYEVLSKYDTDVFGHVWWSGNNETYINSTWANISKVPTELPDSIEVLNSAYNPKILRNDPSRIFKYDDEIADYYANNINDAHHSWWTTGTVNHSNVLSQLYSISEGSKLVEKYSFENSIKYDVVVMTRYDSKLFNLPDLNMVDISKFYTASLNISGSLIDDNLLVFDAKYLEWSSNLFNDIQYVYKDITQPTPEHYKFTTFKRRFSTDNMVAYPMSIQALHR